MIEHGKNLNDLLQKLPKGHPHRPYLVAVRNANAAALKLMYSEPKEIKVIPPNELGIFINEAFGASLREDQRLDEVFPQYSFGKGATFDNIDSPLKEKWQETLAKLSKGQRSLFIMSLNHINRYRRHSQKTPDPKIGNLETVADLIGLSQEDLKYISGVGKKSAALLHTAFKKNGQPQPVGNNSSS